MQEIYQFPPIPLLLIHSQTHTISTCFLTPLFILPIPFYSFLIPVSLPLYVPFNLHDFMSIFLLTRLPFPPHLPFRIFLIFHIFLPFFVIFLSFPSYSLPLSLVFFPFKLINICRRSNDSIHAETFE